MSKDSSATGGSEPRKRTSRVHKGIRRTLKTADFEGIVIEEFIEEDVEWSSLEERQKKLDNWNKILVAQFKRTHDFILDECEVVEHRAYKKKTGKPVDTPPNPAVKEDILDDPPGTEKTRNIGQVDFDSLDEIG